MLDTRLARHARVPAALGILLAVSFIGVAGPGANASPIETGFETGSAADVQPAERTTAGLQPAERTAADTRPAEATVADVQLAEATGGAISYQGRLANADGSPFDGQADFVFQLWDAPTGGTQRGTDIAVPSVAVRRGVFTAALNVPADTFDGRALWLRVQVNGEWLAPRQPLLATPYAMGLRPGALIVGAGDEPVARISHSGGGVGLAVSSQSGQALNAVSDSGTALVASAGMVPALIITGSHGLVALGEETGVTALGGPVGGSFVGEVGVNALGTSHGLVAKTDGTLDGDAGVLGESVNRQVDGVRGIGWHGVHGLGYTGVYGEGSVGVEGEGLVGVRGLSETGDAVHGQSVSGNGVLGESTTAAGVMGRSSGGHGVIGETSNGFSAGVQGVGPTGVYGLGGLAGVSGHSADYTGVLGTTENSKSIAVDGQAGGMDSIGVKGNADLGVGVVGSGEVGVRATGRTGPGVEATGATGVVGDAIPGGGAGVRGTGAQGVYGLSSVAGGEAVRGDGSGSHTEGVLGMASGGNGVGVYGIASGGGTGIGVRADTNATWGFYTGQKLFVGQGCVGCTSALIAVNEGSTLNKGDVAVVTGVAPPLVGHSVPVLTVRRGSRGDGGLLVVVDARLAVQSVTNDVPTPDGYETRTVDMAQAVPGGIAAQDYLLVVVSGLAQVRADATAGAIAAGDRVGAAQVASMDGTAGLLAGEVSPERAFGRALEPLSEGTGLIWVLVSGR